MGCTKDSTKEVMGESTEFLGFESGECEGISVDEAKEQDEKSQEIREH